MSVENHILETAHTMATTRITQTDDIGGILEITNWAIRETASNFNDQPHTLEELTEAWARTHEHYPWLLREDDGEILGYALAAPYKARAAYRWTTEVSVYVAPDHHGNGIGRALYAALLPILEAQGYRTLVGAIALPNPASVRLHESFRFTHWGTLERAGRKFDRWHDVGYWRLRVGDDSNEALPPKNVQEVTGSAVRSTGRTTDKAKAC